MKDWIGRGVGSAKLGHHNFAHLLRDKLSYLKSIWAAFGAKIGGADCLRASWRNLQHYCYIKSCSNLPRHAINHQCWEVGPSGHAISHSSSGLESCIRLNDRSSQRLP